MQNADASNPESATPQATTQPVLKADAPKETPQPVSNALKPDKTVEVPRYSLLMASDAKLDEAAIRAVDQKADSALQAERPRKEQ